MENRKANIPSHPLIVHYTSYTICIGREEGAHVQLSPRSASNGNRISRETAHQMEEIAAGRSAHPFRFYITMSSVRSCWKALANAVSSWSHSLSTLLKCVCLYCWRKRGHSAATWRTIWTSSLSVLGFFGILLIDWLIYFRANLFNDARRTSILFTHWGSTTSSINILFHDKRRWICYALHVYSYYVNGGAMDDARDVLCRCWNFFLPTPLKKNTFPVLFFFPFFIGWLHLTETPQAVQCHLYM